ncbi:palmitoyltransferase ZDHHC23 isoform X1 [Pelobates cultripes]|uniref:Palmitoyltransferase n=1 Tax=Pelobates cultripes TaxID=61616 RepID=A0AAD1QXF3_PELCU|nr:palmitoyltransferase ZDHHC23 isoform X1 [Pelobates cultripes]
MGGKAKRKSRSESEHEDGLCCCEYINQNGQRSHLAACLCDCADLDQACDGWITCKPSEPQVWARAVETAADRFRVPWIRGAKKVDVSLIPPLLLLPICLHIAALHVLLAVVILTSLPVLVIWYYHLTHQRKGKTLLFLSLALFSLGYMYYTFVQEMFYKSNIGWGHFSVVSCGLLLTILFLVKAKQDPGYLIRSEKTTSIKPEASHELANGFRTVRSASSKEGIALLYGESQIPEKNWCNICQLVKPPRSGHCRICGACVRRMDHHCVWINNCIGERNHKFFILLLILFQFTSIYGITVTLRIICRGQSIFTALLYCPGVYAEYSSSFAFTCVWYCTIVTAGMAYVLLIQLLNISYNITEREARIALREKTGRWILGGLVVYTGRYNHGFFQNWLHFLSLESHTARYYVTDIV